MSNDGPRKGVTVEDQRTDNPTSGTRRRTMLHLISFGLLLALAILLAKGPPVDREDGGRVVVEWKTSVEHQTAGFNLYRRSPSSARMEKVNRVLVPGTHSLAGGVYRVVDRSAQVGRSYEYTLMEVDAGGVPKFLGNRRLATMVGLALANLGKRFPCEG